MPFCPQCGAEYERGVARCSDCEVALDGEPPLTPAHDPEAAERTAVAYVARDEIEAETISELLTEAGIPNFQRPEGPQEIFPVSFTGMASVRLEVMAHDLAAARRVITEFKQGGAPEGSS